MAESLVVLEIFFFRKVNAVAVEAGAIIPVWNSYVTGAVDEHILAVLAFCRY